MDSVTINDDSLSADENTTEIEEKARHGKNQLRITIITVSAFLLLAIIIFVSATTISRHNTNKEPGQYSSIYGPSNASTIKAVCATTRYPDSCYHSISAASSPNSSLDNPEKVFMLSLLVARAAVSNATFMSKFLAAATVDPAAKAALQDCKELFSSAGDHLNDTLALLPADISLASSSQIIEMRTLLSAAVADQATCAEGVAATHLKARMQAATVNSTEYTSNSLAIATHFAGYFDMLPFLFHRKLLDAPGGDDAYYNGKFTVNVTVAKDGTGDLESIGDAIAKAPERSLTPFVIYVKEGVYKEYVVVGESKWNVVVLGDGMHRTLVVGNRSRADGSTAYKSATFTVEGRGFKAIDMGFLNTAAAEKQQAVALLCRADRAVFYRCSFRAFYNTLYTHSLRQLYHDCEVVGATDFIFGDAAAVFQNCTIRPRQTASVATIAAQSRSDPNENTGVVIQGCKIAPFDDGSLLAYLGRPWREYSRMVVMKTEMGKVVAPEGWLTLSPGTVPPNTTFIGEYRNRGLGSNLERRVRWPGYHAVLSDAEAQGFSAKFFLQ